jgi:hypothetical protein
METKFDGKKENFELSNFYLKFIRIEEKQIYNSLLFADFVQIWLVIVLILLSLRIRSSRITVSYNDIWTN